MKIRNRFASALAVALLIPASACLSVDGVRGAAVPAGTVRVVTYRDASAFRVGERFTGRMESRIVRDEPGGAKVFEASTGEFEAGGLPPGRYRLEILRWESADGQGRHEDVETSDFEIRRQEGVQLEVVLRDARAPFWVTVSAISAIAVGIVVARGF
jgi:hypothetical protein